jgi:hypothetical protein
MRKIFMRSGNGRDHCLIAGAVLKRTREESLAERVGHPAQVLLVQSAHEVLIVLRAAEDGRGNLSAADSAVQRLREGRELSRIPGSAAALPTIDRYA